MPDSRSNIVIGLSGGIACYKIATVVSTLAQAGHHVTVIMTEAATRFVGPLTFQALTGNPVITSQWPANYSDEAGGGSSATWHITIARAADLMLIAPCSMDMLAKLATGRTDDPVSLVAAAMDLKRQPILLAPSMNETMWNQPSTQRNLNQLAADGFETIAPASGWQACRTEGTGRLPEPADLLHAIQSKLPSRG